MNIADLHTDIKRSIVKHFTNVFENLSHGLEQSPNAFLEPLPILWVNREWRLLAQDKMYGRAYLNATFETEDSQPLQPYTVDTNIGLICRNKLQHLVKRLKLIFYFTSDEVDIERLVSCIIKIGTTSTTPVKRITNHTVDSLKQLVATVFNGKPDEINNDIGAVLARTFQNVKHIDVSMVQDPKQADKIVAGYGEQLRSVKWHGYNLCLNLSPANEITDLDLCVRILRDDIDLPIATATNPQHLQRCSLKFQKPGHICGIFRWSPDSNMIDFKNLKRLELVGFFGDYIHRFDTSDIFESEDNTCTHGLSFPVLVDLYVYTYFVFRAELECLLQAPLERLSYSGSLAQFLCQFYNKLSPTLKHLTLRFVLDELIDQRKNIIAQDVNKILSHAHGIKTVELEIESEYCKPGIIWPNITHLTLNTPCRAISVMLDIAANAPDLISLKCHMNYYYRVDDDMRYLLNIKKHYSHPSNSKILTLVIINSDSNDRKCESFRNALENLKWYWPNLRYIEMRNQSY